MVQDDFPLLQIAIVDSEVIELIPDVNSHRIDTVNPGIQTVCRPFGSLEFKRQRFHQGFLQNDIDRTASSIEYRTDLIDKDRMRK